MNNNFRFFVSIAAVLVAGVLLMPSAATARSAGTANASGNPWSNGGKWCVACHSDLGETPLVVFTGPQNLVVNQVADYSVKVCGGPAVAGGFNTNSYYPNPNNADAVEPIGTFIVNDPGTWIPVAGNITQTTPRPFAIEPDGVTSCATFTFQWQAPNYPVSTTLYTAVLSSDLTGNTTGDTGAKTELAVNVGYGDNLPPAADPGGPYEGVVGSPVMFDGSRSLDPDGVIVSYIWDFGDGSSSITVSSPAVTHTYLSAGTYTVSLRGIDDAGLISGPGTTTATIFPAGNVAPTAAAGGPYTGVAGTPVTFDGSASSDANGDALNYHWHFGDTYSGMGVSATHIYARSGTYNVTLLVDDGELESVASSATATIGEGTVLLPPTADAGGPYAGARRSSIQFDASGSSDRDGSIADYRWFFGDGATAQGITVNHSYAAEGTYAVTLTVTDNDGLQASDSTTATIAKK